MGRKPTDIIQVNLRLREDMRRRLAREAEKNNRSINAEMVARLEASFAAESRTAMELLEDLRESVQSAISTIATQAEKGR